MITADQRIRNLSMKIGEVDSGSARLLATKVSPSTLITLFPLKKWKGKGRGKRVPGNKRGPTRDA